MRRVMDEVSMLESQKRRVMGEVNMLESQKRVMGEVSMVESRKRTAPGWMILRGYTGEALVRSLRLTTRR